MSGKFQLGQKLTASVREAIVSGLLERDGPRDRDAALRVQAAGLAADPGPAPPGY